MVVRRHRGYIPGFPISWICILMVKRILLPALRSSRAVVGQWKRVSPRLRVVGQRRFWFGSVSQWLWVDRCYTFSLVSTLLYWVIISPDALAVLAVVKTGQTRPVPMDVRKPNHTDSPTKNVFARAVSQQIPSGSKHDLLIGLADHINQWCLFHRKHLAHKMGDRICRSYQAHVIATAVS